MKSRCISSGQAVPDNGITSVLRAIAEMPWMTIAQIASEIGRSEIQCVNNVSRLRINGDIEAVDKVRPYRWSVTKAGLKRLDEGLPAARPSTGDATPEDGLNTVQAALRSRPALQQVWSSA